MAFGKVALDAVEEVVGIGVLLEVETSELSIRSGHGPEFFELV